MEITPKETVLGDVECSGCGGSVPMKVNENGCCYAICNARTGRRAVDKNGTERAEQCMSRYFIGRFGSEKIIEEFLQNKEDITGHAETEHEQEENTEIGGVGADIPESSPATGGDLSEPDREQIHQGHSGDENREHEPEHSGIGAALREFFS